MKAKRSQFLQHLNFELLSLCTRSLSQVLSAAGETLGVFFCLKCHSATVMNKGMRRGHTQSHMLKVMRNSSALHITRKGVFHCYLQQDCPLSVFVAAPHRVALCCLVYSQMFLSPVLFCREREVKQHLLVLLVPGRPLTETSVSYSIFPTSQCCR